MKVDVPIKAPGGAAWLQTLHKSGFGAPISFKAAVAGTKDPSSSASHLTEDLHHAVPLRSFMPGALSSRV